MATTNAPAAARGPQGDGRHHRVLPTGTIVGLVVAIVTVLIFGAMSYRSLRESAATANRLHRTQESIDTLQALLSDLKDAETGQRGFLLTGRPDYLGPYTAARSSVPRAVAAVQRAVGDDPVQRPRGQELEQLARAKLDELEETIQRRRANDLAGALDIVQSDRGKAAMDRLRQLVLQMQATESAQLADREREWRAAVDRSFLVTIGGAAILIALIAGAGVLLARAYRERETENWLRATQSGLAAAMLGRQQLDMLGRKVVTYLSQRLDAAVATIYLDEGEAGVRYLAGYADDGLPGGGAHVGAGLLAQAARDDRVIHVRDVPDGYLPVRSSLGRARPHELVLVPTSVDGIVMAVMEFGFLRPTPPRERELLTRVAPSVAVAIRSAREAMRIDDLLEETQRQTEELQTQQEELRVSNEELEEQGRALKASQGQLEGQQAELEQTNAQLEEQAQILETQKDALARSQKALEEQADELERSNQYKSEFLANMSHELRTPLNSTLILAKLLADNKSGNLTAEQVQFAQTISSAGNDLLTLINDILDLSKIEAGKVEITIEPVGIARVVEGLVKTFEPTAKEKKLAFETTVEPGAADRIETDAQRLAQILHNLLSNALKFTAQGRVALRVFAPSNDTIAFAVSDTGIGIAAHQQEIIFEAFRQADGSTHRRYGGTGLGLSISRDLARLLGGDIAVSSRPGQGSTFTLTLPTAGPRVAAGDDGRCRRCRRDACAGAAARDTGRAGEARGVVRAGPQSERRTGPAGAGRRRPRAARPGGAPDPRDRGRRALRRDPARPRARDGLPVHRHAHRGRGPRRRRSAIVPSAILLDMNLPDHSGLGVLDQLKQQPEDAPHPGARRVGRRPRAGGAARSARSATR